jgi:hypothetical protein
MPTYCEAVGPVLFIKTSATSFDSNEEGRPAVRRRTSG